MIAAVLPSVQADPHKISISLKPVIARQIVLTLPSPWPPRTPCRPGSTTPPHLHTPPRSHTAVSPNLTRAAKPQRADVAPSWCAYKVTQLTDASLGISFQRSCPFWLLLFLVIYGNHGIMRAGVGRGRVMVAYALFSRASSTRSCLKNARSLYPNLVSCLFPLQKQGHVSGFQ